MSTVEQLKNESQLPADLKALMAELHVPTNDPVIPLLAWIWKQMIDTKSVLDAARLSTQAMFDTRMERMGQMAELMLAVELTLKGVKKELESKPLRVKEQVEKELETPLKSMIASYAILDQQVKCLLQRIDRKTASTTIALYVTLLALGFIGGVLTLCLGHIYGWL